jgi:hypothetical protein
MNLPATTLPIACVLALLCTAGDASAGGGHAMLLPRSFVQNGTGACQAALPYYEGAIRKRPLAIQNEGDASAFINCSLVGTERSTGGLQEAQVVVLNITDGPLDVSCTLIGEVTEASMAFLPKTVTVPANQSGSAYMLRWDATDIGGTLLKTANLSCNVPAGAGLGETSVQFYEYVGD